MKPPVRPVYPATAAARDRWILQQRGERVPIDLWRPQGWFVEAEAAGRAAGQVSVLTVLLSSRECPWRCLMCDLWRHTSADAVPPGAIPAQIEVALRDPAVRTARPPVIKLYNSGSFLDPLAVPPIDYPQIATQLEGFERVIVECHPGLIGPRLGAWQAALAGIDGSPPRLEVAMGLETAHRDTLERLNKRITLEGFRRAAGRLRARGVDLRAFVLVRPPFLDPSAALEWAVRSADFAFDCGAGAVTLIPTRAGNGALEALAAAGAFAEPDLSLLEAALEAGLALGRGRVFADLWDLDRFARCHFCFQERRHRLEIMNLTQRIQPQIWCGDCGEAVAAPR